MSCCLDRYQYEYFNCSEVCMCRAAEEICDNMGQDHPMGIDDNEEEEDGEPSM